MNAQSHQTRTGRVLEATPSPPLLKWTGPKVWGVLIARPFHFCLDKAVVLRSCSGSNCALNMAQRSIQSGVCVFSLPRRPNRLYHRPLQKKKPLKQQRTPSQPPAIKRQKKKEYSKASMTDFSWHRHEDDATLDTGKSGVSAWPSFSRQSCARVGNWSGMGNKTKTRGRSG